MRRTTSRRAFGARALAGMAAIAGGLDAWADGGLLRVQAPARRLNLPSEGTMPPIGGAVEWLNSPPLTTEGLRGKVVLVDFWTFGCINCRNALPYVREWHRKYKDQGLVVVGVHTPEFAYEKNIANVKRALGDLNVSFPVAIDNNFAIWRAFSNTYWPAHYFVDAKGQIRFHHFGEGEYEKSEQVIQQLLDEAKKEARPV
jgi:thiol-disulfide isomerase/thioredoxin